MDALKVERVFTVRPKKGSLFGKQMRRKVQFFSCLFKKPTSEATFLRSSFVGSFFFPSTEPFASSGSDCSSRKLAKMWPQGIYLLGFSLDRTGFSFDDPHGPGFTHFCPGLT